MKAKINNFFEQTRVIKLSVLVLSTFLFTANTSAQQVEHVKETLFNEDATACNFEKFTTKQMEEKVYLNWTLVSSVENRFFVIERSVNGTDYKAIGMKKATVSPNNIALLYSFIDENPLSANAYYRISLFEANGQIVASIKSESVYSLNKLVAQKR